MANIPILKQSLMGVEALKESIRKAKRSFLSKEEVWNSRREFPLQENDTVFLGR